MSETLARTKEKVNLLGLDRAGMEQFFVETLGEKRFRAEQVMKWIHHHHITDFEQMTNLGKGLRERLQATAEIVPPDVLFQKESADGTYKWLLGFGNINAVEAVYIPEKDRGTLCVSSQVGCALACAFCSTGAQGFNRNLSTAEIIGQVWVAARHLGNVPHHQRRLTNVVMMGMGEPLLNFKPVVTALKIMRDDLGYGLAAKRVTVSTAGVVPKIEQLSEEIDVALAVSLHAANDMLRSELMPINRKYPIEKLLTACEQYVTRRKGASVTFEYTLMAGVNDQPEHARELVELLRAFNNRAQAQHAAKVNLIPFNPFAGSQFRRPSAAAIWSFQEILQQGGILAMVRRTRGDDIDAACGQLKGRVLDRTRRQEQYRVALAALDASEQENHDAMA